MKRRLIAKNKWLLSAKFKRNTCTQQYSLCSEEAASFASISASKLRGQLAFARRIVRQRRMNARQLKKYRKKQAKSGLLGSKYDGMCKSVLKPAGFFDIL